MLRYMIKENNIKIFDIYEKFLLEEEKIQTENIQKKENEQILNDISENNYIILNSEENKNIEEKEAKEANINVSIVNKKTGILKSSFYKLGNYLLGK